MRTPNTECCICKKPLYRRKFEFNKARHFACMEHRSQAQKQSGQTELQIASLALGRSPGHTRGKGRQMHEDTKRKISSARSAWCKNNPEKVKAAGAKTRGPNKYNWKGGSTGLNLSIRRMSENRKWMDAVKKRDGKCCKCGSTEKLESHHLIPLCQLIESNKITSRDEARECVAFWDISNGITLCQKCHYKLHGRKHED